MEKHKAVLAIIIASACAFAVGITAAAVITTPRRAAVQSRIADAEDQAEKISRQYKQARQTIARLTAAVGEYKDSIEKLESKLHEQTEKDQTEAEAEKTDKQNDDEKNEAEYYEPEPTDTEVVVEQAMFGIHLGESLADVRRRFTVTTSSYQYTDPDNPGQLWEVSHSNPAVDRIVISTFGQRVVWIRVEFDDTSASNFNSLRESLRHRYGPEKQSSIQTRLGDIKYSATISGVEVSVMLEHEPVMQDELALNYMHIPLQATVTEAIRQAKAEKVIDDL